MSHFFALHRFRLMSAVCLLAGGLLHGQFVHAQNKTLRIGVPTSVQLQVGRDTLTAVKMAVDEINKKGVCSAVNLNLSQPMKPKIQKPVSAPSRS